MVSHPLQSNDCCRHYQPQSCSGLSCTPCTQSDRCAKPGHTPTRLDPRWDSDSRDTEKPKRSLHSPVKISGEPTASRYLGDKQVKVVLLAVRPDSTPAVVVFAKEHAISKDATSNTAHKMVAMPISSHSIHAMLSQTHTKPSVNKHRRTTQKNVTSSGETGSWHNGHIMNSVSLQERQYGFLSTQ